MVLFCVWHVPGRRHKSLFRIVQLQDAQENYIILRNQTARRINDDRTVKTLGYDPSRLVAISKAELEQYKLDKPLPPIFMAVSNPDEVMRIEILKSIELQGDLLHDFFHFGEYINPGVALFHDRLLMFTGLAWTLDTMNEGHPPDEFLYYRWLNHSTAPYTEKEAFGLSDRISQVSPGGILGQDPRVVVVRENDEEVAHVTFTNRFVVPIRMSKVTLVVNKTTNAIQARDYLFTVGINAPHAHKNWTPFIYNQTKVYYITFINPLEIVEIGPMRKRSDGSDGVEADAVPVSSGPRDHLDWHHGELRGGSNAIFLEEYNVYLCFHHSSTRLEGNSMTTYFMGAFTFNAHPPFRLKQMSALPIMHESLYTGKRFL